MYRQNTIVHCLTRLRPEKNSYPALDIPRLYNILTTEKSLEMANPGLAGGGQEEETRVPDRFVKRDRYQEHMHRQREEREMEERRATEQEREQEMIAIDVNASMKRFDEPRLKLLLDFFTEHFLKMAERSTKHKNLGQSYMYLRSAENLMSLIEEMGYQCVQAKEQVKYIIKCSYFLVQVLKLRESTNYLVYINDYWVISYGNPGLGSCLEQGRRPSTHTSLPDLPP